MYYVSDEKRFNGEGGPRNGGWGPTGSRSIAAGGSLSPRSLRREVNFFVFFVFPYSPDSVLLSKDITYFVLNKIFRHLRNVLL